MAKHPKHPKGLRVKGFEHGESKKKRKKAAKKGKSKRMRHK
jgi:hypothetical protein